VILVFGGGGQLGRELLRLSSARGMALTALLRAQADIAETSDVAGALAKYQPKLIVNAAAYTKVDVAEVEIEQARLANEVGPGVLAEHCNTMRLPLVHISTDYVFDGRKRGAYLETDPVIPINVYGATKAAGEAAVRGRLERHVIIRTGWIYGEFGHNFLKTVLDLALVEDQLRIVADQTGNPTSARVLAEAILRIVPRLLPGAENCWGTYHFSGAGTTSWHGLASRIVAAQAPLTGRNPKVEAITTAEYPTRARRPSNAALDCSRFARVFGFTARPWAEEVDTTTRAVVASRQRTSTNVA
jgi:dTDP-4-dehydrorhamnose reductase